MKQIPGVKDARVYDRTMDAIILFTGARADVLAALARFSYESAEKSVKVPEHTPRALNRDFEETLISTVFRRFAVKLFFPMPVRAVLSAVRAVKYICKGLKALWHGKLTVSVLDAAAVTVSLIRGDFSTAGSVMFMLRIGEILEDWTHKKSVADLAGAMSLNVDKVWVKNDVNEELLPIGEVRENDLIIVRTGSLIPLDGKIAEGEATVNQSSMTGESLPVRKSVGSYVYAGTVVEEGECVIRVEKTSGGGRYDRIVKMIEDSEKLKSTAEDRASRLADKLVPYTLGGTALTYFLTRNLTKTLAVLMVDFSCALKLSIPIAVLSGMRECHKYRVSVKGGRFLEAVAKADTVVFDKTGTLTYAKPRVAEIVTFGGRAENDMLRLALRNTIRIRLPTLSLKKPRRAASIMRNTIRAWNMWWRTAFPAWWKTKKWSSAARTLSLKTRAARSRKARKKNIAHFPASIRSCILLYPEALRLSSVFPTRYVPKRKRLFRHYTTAASNAL